MLDTELNNLSKEQLINKVMSLDSELVLAKKKNNELDNRYKECYSTLCTVRKLVCGKFKINTDILDLNCKIVKLKEQVTAKQCILNRLQKGN